MSAPLTIGDVFRNAARATPTRPAAVFGDSSITFGYLNTASNRVAHSLEAMGVGHGDRVVVWSATSLDVLPLFAGLAKLGAVFAPVGTGLSIDEAKAVIASATPALVVTDRARSELGEIAAAEVCSPLGRLDGLAGGHRDDGGAGHLLVDAAAAASERDLAPGLVSEDDAHVVFFTSGSSGRPKGALLSHRVNYLRSHPGALLEPRGPMVCPYPLFHMGAWTIALQQWQARDVVVLTRSADADDVTRAVVSHSATRINAIPAVWRRILERPSPSPPLDSLRFADTGTSATPLELLEAIERVAPNAHIRVFYGSTEAGSVTSLDHVDIRCKPGSCGVPGPSTQLRLDHAGELWVRSPLLFDGYLNDPDATNTVLVDGWYRTGDLATEDEDGYLTIVGRADDVIRTGGETVAPAEVEQVVALVPGVVDVAVVGIPDTQWGEVVCAAVVVGPGGVTPTLEDLRERCRDHLAGFKHPRRMVILDAIPRTPSTAQVQRRVLLQQIQPEG
jgi:acyl-CoA synthetase (AMP-forming)/AMP-acid ligase II